MKNGGRFARVRVLQFRSNGVYCSFYKLDTKQAIQKGKSGLTPLGVMGYIF